jgi:hypothetical protein
MGTRARMLAWFLYVGAEASGRVLAADVRALDVPFLLLVKVISVMDRKSWSKPIRRGRVRSSRAP